MSTATTEYSNGVATRENARFRSYGSYADSFRDYARLIGTNPRYAAVVGQTTPPPSPAACRRPGYATDPNYADKLARIINGNTCAHAPAAAPPAAPDPLVGDRARKLAKELAVHRLDT